MVAISSFILVFSPTVATDKVAFPSALLILWTTSSKIESLSPIFASVSLKWVVKLENLVVYHKCAF